MIYAGTDDGLVQVTEDGGKNWRKVEKFPGVPKWTYVYDVFASPRDVNTVFVALNNWQRGDYKPYLREEHGSRPDLDVACRRSAGHVTTCGRCCRIMSTATCCLPAPSSALFTSVDGGQNGCS